MHSMDVPFSAIDWARVPETQYQSAGRNVDSRCCQRCTGPTHSRMMYHVAEGQPHRLTVRVSSLWTSGDGN